MQERPRLAASKIEAMLLAELKKLPSLQDTRSVRIRPHCGPEAWTWMLDRVQPELQPGPPMSLANMRANGVRAVTATCQACNHSADVNVDALPETLTVPEAGKRLRCSQCGGKRVWTKAAWHTGTRRHGAPDTRAPGG